MSNKPMIRHCVNCEYAKNPREGYRGDVFCDCTVKYIRINDPRKTALFCPYFQIKRSRND